MNIVFCFYADVTTVINNASQSWLCGVCASLIDGERASRWPSRRSRGPLSVATVTCQGNPMESSLSILRRPSFPALLSARCFWTKASNGAAILDGTILPPLVCKWSLRSLNLFSHFRLMIFVPHSKPNRPNCCTISSVRCGLILLMLAIHFLKRVFAVGTWHSPWTLVCSCNSSILSAHLSTVTERTRLGREGDGGREREMGGQGGGGKRLVTFHRIEPAEVDEI